MKKYILFLSVFGIGVAQAQADKTPYMTKLLSTASIKQVNVETSGGSISVAGVSPAEAKVEVYISGNNGNKDLSKEEIQSRLNEYYDFKVDVSGNTLTASAKTKKNNMDWKKSLNISFKVYVPSAVSTDLSTSGGSISLDNLNGNHVFQTSGGSLHVDKVSGKIDGKTSGGSIHLSNSQNDIDLATSGGSIEAKNCKGKLELSTSGGSLNLADLEGSIEANTSGGQIDGSNIKGELSASTSGGSVRLTNIAASLETSTSGGSMNIEISELSKFVKVSNSGGNINLQLPANKGLDLELHGNKIKTGELKNFSGSVDDNSVDGKLNGGGIRVSAHASSGNINLSFK